MADSKSGDLSFKIAGVNVSMGVVVGIGLLGMLFVLVSSFTPSSTADNTPQEGSGYGSQYVTDLEEKLRSVLSVAEGVGEVTVMITTGEDGENVYAKEVINDQERYIMVDGVGGQREALVVSQVRPEILGVIILCEGGDNPVVVERINEITTTALGVNSLQVCILKKAN